jgi:hypothetical protein
MLNTYSTPTWTTTTTSAPQKYQLKYYVRSETKFIDQKTITLIRKSNSSILHRFSLSTVSITQLHVHLNRTKFKTLKIYLLFKTPFFPFDDLRQPKFRFIGLTTTLQIFLRNFFRKKNPQNFLHFTSSATEGHRAALLIRSRHSPSALGTQNPHLLLASAKGWARGRIAHTEWYMEAGSHWGSWGFEVIIVIEVR